MDEGELLQRCELLVEEAKRAGADEAEAAMALSRSTETHIENNDIHTVQSSEEATFGLRVLVGSSLGFVTANDTDPGLLRSRAAEAVAQASVTPADDFNGLPSPLPLTAVEGLYDDAIAQLDATYTTETTAKLIDRIRSRDQRVRIDSGSVRASVATVALASSTGIRCSERSSSLDGYLFGMAVDGSEVASFDYDGESSRALAPFESSLELAADRFVDKCLAGLGAGSGESFKGTVLLAPEAVAEFLLPTLVGALCADVVRKGRSPLAGKLDSTIAWPGFSLIDDGSLAGGVASSAFDREGLPVRRRVIIDGGTLKSYLYNHYEARAAGGDIRSTGHASGSVSSLPGIGPTHLEVAAGETPAAQLLSSSEKAVIANRFSGSTNPVTGDFSGVVKNGFFVCGGEKRPVKEILMAGNLFSMLEGISTASIERRTIGGARLVPTLRLEEISITAG